MYADHQGYSLAFNPGTGNKYLPGNRKKPCRGKEQSDQYHANPF